MTTAMFIITSNNRTPQPMEPFLSTPAPASKQWRSDCSQLTHGGSKVKWPCQSTIVGTALVYVTSHRQEAENGLI